MRIVSALLLAGLTFMVSGCTETTPDKAVPEKTRTDEKISFYEKKIETDPGSCENYNRLAQAYIQKARETGDVRYYKLSGDAVRESLKVKPGNYDGLAYMAMIDIAGHNFKEARTYAERAVELEPGKSYAYGILGDAELDLGNVGKAEEAYNKMVELKPGLDSWSRVSNIRVVKGDTQGAAEAMDNAYQEGLKSAGTSKENLAWTKVMKGSVYLGVGELDRAESHYREALEIMPDYYLALEHLAEISALRGDNEQAVRLYTEVLKMNPAPEFYLALAGVYYNEGKTDEARELDERARRIYEEKVGGGDVGYLRALALYYADRGENLERALALAEKDLEIRKDYGAYDTLGWVYYKSGNYDKALAIARESVKQGTKNSKLYYHLGMINYKLGNYAEAEKYLSEAVSLNPYFDKKAAIQSKETLEIIKGNG